MADPESTKENRGRWRSLLRPGRSSLLLAMLIVLPPWILVAVPGDDLGSVTLGSCTIRHHGWPFTHQRTAKIHFTRAQENFYLSGPTNWNSDKVAARQLKRQDKKRPGSLEPIGTKYVNQIEHSQLGLPTSHFWSDIRNWPVQESANGWAWQILWPQLIANLVFVTSLILILATLISFRFRRRRKWFSFSLFEFAFVLPLIGVAITLIAVEYRRAAREQELVTLLVNSSRNGYAHRKSPALPRFLFNLLNHRTSLPGSQVPLFANVESFSASPDGINPKDLVDCPFPVGWNLGPVSTPDVEFLESIDRSKTEQLTFKVKSVLKTYGMYDTAQSTRLKKTDPVAYWETFMPLPNDFPNLKSLRVKLNESEIQGPQLERIAKIESFSNLEVLILIDLDDTGKEWLKQNSDKLPKEVREE